MKKSEIFIKVRNYHADNHNHVNNARGAIGDVPRICGLHIRIYLIDG
jgi:hypothetical protein